MDKRRKRLGTLADILVLGGWVLLSAGVWRLNAEAGMIVAGGIAFALGALLERGLDG